MSRTSWQTETVTFTPTTDIIYLSIQATGTLPPAGGPCFRECTQIGAVLIDNLRTLTGLVLQQADGTAQPADKAFRLLWQPVLSVVGLDSLARPQLRGTVTTFQGGHVSLPKNLRVRNAKGFYFLQEAAPAAGQDTTYYGLYVRNTPLANGARDDTLRHLYQCRRSFGSQASLPSGPLAPLALGSPSASPTPRAAPSLAAPIVGAGHLPTAPEQGPDPLAGPQPRRRTPRQQAR
ncbi:hypothetical protein IC235_02975 [Hymenobacter sp. BT664]|uniref:Uncharacterized protein n=1 Tax=Hymenobacter montanus TaxID=2771359 RepID=A0A927GHX0_9BACT|nr:hypothetical protein [Hymenobacter montanus]MBD2766853.1 hypothetical protein [Hymenobacter montanus]